MADERTNIQKLVDAGVLDETNMSDDHKHAVNSALTDDEVKALIKAKMIVGGTSATKWKPAADGGAF